jgi:hypothetical protein
MHALQLKGMPDRQCTIYMQYYPPPPATPALFSQRLNQSRAKNGTPANYQAKFAHDLLCNTARNRANFRPHYSHLFLCRGTRMG